MPDVIKFSDLCSLYLSVVGIFPFWVIINHIYVLRSQKPGKKGQGEGGWAMQAKLDIYLWLGEYDKTSQPTYLSNLPAGYEPQYEDTDHTKPPIAVIYEG